jgi:ParB family transcriptional regulator, chromosome partitioning protein
MESKINANLAKLAVKIETLKPDEKNARSHSERNIKLIADSLEMFGQQKPIVVDKQSKILAGNGTVLAAKGLGWKTIAAVTIDVTDEALRRAYALMDNRTAELAEWDASTLQEAIAALEIQGVHAQQVGFEEVELKTLLSRLNVEPPADFSTYDEGSVETNCKCPKCGYEWKKGKE